MRHFFLAVLLFGGGGLFGAERGDASAAFPLFVGIGTHTRKISTSSPEAQRYFDQGVAFVGAFNHAAALRSFQRAAELDPQCAMAWWGVALANGPHINLPTVSPENAAAAVRAIRRAKAGGMKADAVESELVDAMAQRYADPQPADRAPLDLAYADAMRAVWTKHPHDADAGTWFAEALMDVRPWDQWTLDGRPQPGTEELIATLKAVLVLDSGHPQGNHLYIHAVEASSHPEDGLAAADRLTGMAPTLGHMVHMPSHIYVLTGRWSDAIEANENAVAADLSYRKAVHTPYGFYQLYTAHNRHMLAWAAMMSGRSALALSQIRLMVEEIPPDYAQKHAGPTDFFIAMPYEVLLRFGQWDAMLAQPEPPEYLPMSRALRLAGRGVALAAKNDLPSAMKAQALFRLAVGKIPPETPCGNTTAQKLLPIAEHMLAGEILVRAGKLTEGIAELRSAVAAEDALPYDEPPDWILPVRHSLGASLLLAEKLAEAETVYREDLLHRRNNGWALFGLARTLRLEQRVGEAAEVETRFRQVWSQADFKLTSSCLCQPGV